jgi:hypothetical protein
VRDLYGDAAVRDRILREAAGRVTCAAMVSNRCVSSGENVISLIAGAQNCWRSSR